MKTARYEIGCYGDGALGHQHTREMCASRLGRIIRSSNRTAITSEALRTASNLMFDLEREMSDDASEELTACDWLNAYAPVEGASWDWRDGDFGLWPNSEE